MKLHPDLDNLTNEILNRDPNGIYLLIDSDDKILTELVKKRLEKTHGVNFARIKFFPRLMNGPDYLNVFQVDQLQALAMFFLDLREKAFTVAWLFSGAWLFPLGYLVFKSGFLPKFLGIVLMVHCFTWVSTFFQSFLFPGFNAITYVSYPLGLISELGLTLWLLIMGAKDQKPALVEVG